MGLITKTVMMKWNPKNKKYYESKGYKFTKWKDEFKVRIKDLSKGSEIKVQIKCDGCKKLLNIRWCDYLKCKHINDYIYCQKCGHKLFAEKKTLKAQLEKSKSFYTWCYENLDKEQADKIMNRWDDILNKCSPKNVCYSSNKKYWFKCLNHPEHKSELHGINGFTQGRFDLLECRRCNSFAQYLIDIYGNNALELYWDYDKNNILNINPWKITKSCDKNIWIKCQTKIYHDSYETTCAHFIAGNRCPYCASRQIHPKDSLGQYIVDNYGKEFLNKIWSDKNKKSPFEYSPRNKQKVYWKCFDGKHEDYYRSIGSSNVCEFRCPKCVHRRDESMLEEKVRLYLVNLNIGQVLHEYDCTIIPRNPKTKQKLPFDNELIINNIKHLIIEVNGEQHYKIGSWHQLSAKHFNTTPEYELHYQKLKDRYKRIYAKSKGYYYLEIPYWDIQDNENYKTLINNKINEIKEL